MIIALVCDYLDSIRAFGAAADLIGGHFLEDRSNAAYPRLLQRHHNASSSSATSISRISFFSRRMLSAWSEMMTTFGVVTLDMAILGIEGAVA